MEVSAFVERLSGSHFNDDPDLRYRVRMLIYLQLFVMSTNVFLIVFILLSTFAPETRQVSLILSSVQIVAYTFLIYRIKNHGNYAFVVNSMIIIMSTVIFASIAGSGGPSESIIIHSSFLPIIAAFYFLGKNKGMVWALLISAVVLSMFAIGQLISPYPNFIGDEHESMRDMSFLLGFVATFSFISIYELTFRRLQEERNKSQQRNYYLATHDQLTKVANRRHFYDALEHNIAESNKREKGKWLALFYIDLDGFKSINDSYGHQAGDKVLKEIAQRIKSSIRETDTVARYGGDEFVVLFTSVSDEAGINVIANKMDKEIARPINIGEADVAVKASIGIAIYPMHSKEAEELERLADKAMYEAKINKSGWRFYGDDTIELEN